MAEFERFQAAVRSYLECRSESISRLESIASTINKIGYLSEDKLSISGSVALKRSRIAFSLDCSLSEKISEYLLHRKQVAELVTLISDSNHFKDFPIDFSLLCKIADQVKQQAILESCIDEKFMNVEEELFDNDCFIAMIACFRYSPYLSMEEIKLIAEC